jgi:hypothetical protein
MTAITPAHKKEWNELRRQVDAAVERMNAICVETERDYRATFHLVPYWPLVEDYNLPGDDSDERIGSERAERVADDGEDI